MATKYVTFSDRPDSEMPIFKGICIKLKENIVQCFSYESQVFLKSINAT